MGQRHQTFVVVDRPKKISDTYLKEFKQKLGGNDKIVLPYHHQWLYGFTALSNCLNVLVQGQSVDWVEFDRYAFNFWEKIPKLFKTIQSLTKRNGKINFEGFSYLGDDEPVMRDKFDMGDNNDGITIIYPQQKKYCFMFINEPYDDAEPTEFPRTPYVPFTAEQYLKTYYTKGEELKPPMKGTLTKFSKYELLTMEEIKGIFP